MTLPPKQIPAVSIIDEPIVNAHIWYINTVNGKKYWASNIIVNGKKTIIRLHSIIMNPATGMVVDHINGDTLDNRRENLRVCLQSQNIMNSIIRKDNKTGVKGVTYIKSSKKYRVRIVANKICYNVGCYSTIEDAAIARETAALLYHGEYANELTVKHK
jgi:hypothetical protein